jgi:hypothetical protein
MLKLSTPTQLFDPTVPDRLKNTQIWFGGIIGRPIDVDSRMNPISPRGIPMVEEACEYIAPSPTLRPHQRIEIYNQQFWWRLLSILHEAFPLLTRLFGFSVFNLEIGMPFLAKYPPRHWSLMELGALLPQWIDEEYHQKDRDLVLHAALVDNSFETGFPVAELPSLTTEDCQDSATLLKQKLYLQSHITLFRLPYHLFKFRETFVAQDGNYWLEHDFPPLEKEQSPYCSVVFRNLHNEMIWREITEAQYHLLTLFQNGCSVELACESLEKEHPKFLAQTMKNIHLWFQEWTARKWLTKQKTVKQ